APTLSHGQGNTTFFVTQFSIANYLDLSRLFAEDAGRSILALRALVASAFGATQSVEKIDGMDVRVPDLPPDQRLYAGGSGTVRGYRYQSVGPEFPDGTPIGGTALSAFSIEFRQRIGTSFGAAIFADAGGVGERLHPLSGLAHGGPCSASTTPESTSSCWA